MFEMRGWIRIVVVISCLCLQVVPILGAEPDQMKASTGCGSSPPLKPGGSALATLDFDGLEREYRLHLPAGYDQDTPVPLVLVFHGYTGTAEGTENDDTSFSRHADEHGYAVVYPQATGFEEGEVRITSWNDRACNASPGPEGSTCTEEADDYPTPPECEPRECDWCRDCGLCMERRA